MKSRSARSSPLLLLTGVFAASLAASPARAFVLNGLFSIEAKAIEDYPVRTTHPVIMLTGFWPPTNEMLRPWTQNPLAQLPQGWAGANWEASGYDVVSFFPEFGSGDFKVRYGSTRAVIRDLKNSQR